MSAKVSIPPLMARPPIACRRLHQPTQGRCGAPFLSREFFEQGEELRPLGVVEPCSDAPLVTRDAPAQASRERAPGASEPQAVGASISAAAALDQAAFLEGIDHADHGRAVEAP